jgi:hypothetical protein
MLARFANGVDATESKDTVQTMLSNSASLWLGMTFVLVGAFNVWLILQASARVKDANVSAPLIAALSGSPRHRAS